MLQHVRTCSLLSKGVYRCFESGKVEKIGKCHTEGCQELKGRVATALNSVKRHFSGRGSKSHHTAGFHTAFEGPISPQGTFEMDSTWESGPSAVELPNQESAFGRGVRMDAKPLMYGMDQNRIGFEMPELSGVNNVAHWCNDHAFVQGSISELSAGSDFTQSFEHHHQRNLDSTNNATSNDFPFLPAYSVQIEDVALEQRKSVGKAYVYDAAFKQSQSSAPFSMDSGVSANSPSNLDKPLSSRPRPRKRSTFHPSNPFFQLAQAGRSQQTEHTSGMSGLREKASWGDSQQQASQSEDEFSYPQLCHPPRTNSDMSTDVSEVQSLFSSLSNHNSSFSSLASSNTSLDFGNPIPKSFFGEESSKMCEEPEDLDYFSPPDVHDFAIKSGSTNTGHVDRNGVSWDDYIQPSPLSMEEINILEPSNASTRLTDSNGVSMDDYLVPFPSTTREDHQLHVSTSIPVSSSIAKCDGAHATNIDDDIDQSCYLVNLQSQDS